jgi:hypothetical protein
MTNQEILEKAIQKAIAGYEATQVGRIWNRKTGKEVRGSINHKGYRYISVYLPETGKSKKITVHKLVALAHIPNPDKLPHINHKDGNRLNNAAWNLEWCTASYNVSDGFKRGRVVWNKGNISKERVLFYAKKYPRQLFWLLTKDDFMVAKALWGEGSNEGFSYDLKDWEFHLQQMVIAADPIAYLGDNLHPELLQKGEE